MSGAGDPLLNAWLDAHERLETWSAELVQTRHLAALTHPLVSTGRVYYSRPGRFRWELGQPPETVAIRSSDTLLLIYPALNRAERYASNQGGDGPLPDVLSLMDVGFPKDRTTLIERYQVRTEPLADERCRIRLQPRNPSASRLVTSVSLTFRTNAFTLTETEIEFADHSRLHNQFRRSTANEPLAPGLFDTNLPAGCKLVEPFKR